ncbi:type II toxin-antitoxin system PemK/MazF family toxin [Rudanella lutea]|uniref:type II toxin-antitoxin system PemK/MazF family toxin n=1 Tax=Rudanella lutea TaxID=451374 RepID=UPI0003658E3B|nr:type II toxin-antitoxin system PemK/MazF family toxin [Rudanella lutea]
MSLALYQPGDLVVVHFPFTDITSTKRRPALVISNEVINQTGDYLLMQVTSQVKHDGLSIPLLAANYSGAPLPLTSFVRIHKIFLLNESLIVRKVAATHIAFRDYAVSQLIKLIS